MRGSDTRRQPHATASGYGAASTARGGDDTPADAENVAVDMKNDDRWTKQLCASTATRVLLAMALFGIIGTLLPVFAMRLGVRLPQVSSDRPRRTRAFTSVGLGDRHRGGVIKGKGGEKKASLSSVAGLGSYGGETSLIGTPLKPCSGPDQAEATGWDRSGSCAWDPTDSGYHEVCVQMDSQFLANSATMDGNDLSSVVGHGEHWCVCAWAFASAVDRDPTAIEGLQLMCDESNSKLREVYQHYIDEGEGLTGPTGNSYGPTEALAAVNRLCPEPSAGWDVIAQSGLMAS